MYKIYKKEFTALFIGIVFITCYYTLMRENPQIGVMSFPGLYTGIRQEVEGFSAQ